MRRSFRNPTDGGGNILPPNEFTVRRVAALGDSLCASIIADRLVELGHIVHWQTHPHVMPVMSRVPSVKSVSPYMTHCDVNLDKAYEQFDGTPTRQTIHFHDAFWKQAQTQLKVRGIDLGKPTNCRPTLRVTEAEKSLAAESLKQYPKPWVFICPRSQYYEVRTVPDHIWETAAKEIKGTAFWIGLLPAPKGIVDLQCRNVDQLIVLLSVADLLATVDSGPLHMASALRTPIIAILQSSSPERHLTDISDFECISLNLGCENCCLLVCPKGRYSPPCQHQDPHQIAQAVNRKLGIVAGRISAIIPIFQPDAKMLNDCLNAILPQVAEVIVTREMGGVVPAGTVTHPKIRHVQKSENGIGFGRNCNFGARHSSGEFILMLNDDVTLSPDAVKRMMEVMTDKVGIVGHLTRYPSGRIYHAGKQRKADGSIGHPHIDYNEWHPTIQQPVEMENTNGASILFRRKAFYEVGGYDENIAFYTEDDDICMKIRKAGWRLFYTPLATGIHYEHAETSKLPNINAVMQWSNDYFGRKWKKYFEHNRGNLGLGNFQY